MMLLLAFLLGMLAGTLVAFWLLRVRLERRPRVWDTVHQVVIPGQVLWSFTRRKQ